MNCYRVLSSDPDTAILAIEDDSGKCYLGRALTAPPPSGTVLHGDLPALGLRELHAPNKVVPVVLVLLDCDKAVAVVVAGELPGLAAAR